MASKEYLEGFLSTIKNIVDSDIYAKIHNYARAYAGGKAKGRIENPTILEKVTVAEMRPSVLRELPDDEVLQAWHRLNQLYGGARKQGRAIEDYVNAAIFVIDEMLKRGMKIDEDLELYQESEKLRAVTKSGMDLDKNLGALPEEIMVIPDFVSIVGSVLDKKNPNDLDIVIRAESDNDENYKISKINIGLGIRNAIKKLNKELELHMIPNNQGPRDNYLPLYHLTLRRSMEGKRVIKSSNFRYIEAIDIILEAIDDEINN